MCQYNSINIKHLNKGGEDGRVGIETTFEIADAVDFYGWPANSSIMAVAYYEKANR